MMAVAGFILAGGQSSRMGRDKALLTVGQWLLIELVIERMRPQVDQVIIIGHAANAERLSQLDVDAILTDIKPSWGPLMGMYTGLLYSSSSLNLFVPCDMPWVEAQMVDRLLDRLEPGVEAIASRDPSGRVYPFPLLCRLSACRIIGALLDRGTLSLHDFLRQPSARLVTIHEPELLRGFMNINTVAEYEQLSHETALSSRL